MITQATAIMARADYNSNEGLAWILIGGAIMLFILWLIGPSDRNK